MFLSFDKSGFSTHHISMRFLCRKSCSWDPQNTFQESGLCPIIVCGDLWKKSYMWETENRENWYLEVCFFCIGPRKVIKQRFSRTFELFWFLGEQFFCIETAGILVIVLLSKLSAREQAHGRCLCRHLGSAASRGHLDTATSRGHLGSATSRAPP